MPPTRKRTAAEVWQILLDEAGEDLIEEAAAVPYEHAVKELTEAGFDVDAELARGEAYLQAMERGGTDDPEASPPSGMKTK